MFSTVCLFNQVQCLLYFQSFLNLILLIYLFKPLPIDQPTEAVIFYFLIPLIKFSQLIDQFDVQFK
jgi:hypothetical protein